ncbi:MAG: efflux RND transporter periplasmic adaptor subunit [Leptolyngbya sp. SIO4C1]|nr:efflux RND transporter periplasmic adaptor subunit [Leptolyngbya sp. SIO4C1]
MQLPLVGKVKRPVPWLVGLVLLGLLSTGAIAAVIWRSRLPQYDVAELTVPTESAAVTVRISASGVVEPVRTVNLSPKAAGIVEALLVEQGDAVRAGQAIARMDSEDLEAQLRQSQASLTEAEAQLQDTRQGTDPAQLSQAAANLDAVEAQIRDAEARLDLARADYARSQSLYDSGAISRSELDRDESEVRSAEAALAQANYRVEEARQRLIDLENDPDPEAVDQAEARVERAEAQLAGVQTQLDDTVIRAPFAGIITQKFATEGAFVTPTTSASTASSATSTAIVALADGLEVVAEVPEADIGQIEVGQAVEIQADAFPEEIFRGEVKLIAPEAIEKQNVTVFQVRVRLEEGLDKLRSNMKVDVAFIGNQLSDALVIPTVAVVTQGGETGVLVPGENNRIQFRTVTLGPQVGDQIQILEGLEVGDPVFVDLPPGQTLENLRFSREGQEE